MKKICLQCGAAFVGRTDKKFCSDQCRSAWHNRRTFDDQTTVRQINRILLHNRRLLFTILEKSDGRIALRELRTQGFHFSFFTHRRSTRFYCYEAGYQIEGRTVRVFRDNRCHEKIWKQQGHPLLLRSNPYAL